MGVPVIDHAISGHFERVESTGHSRSLAAVPLSARVGAIRTTPEPGGCNHSKMAPRSILWREAGSAIE
jgi:hypothetical protein